MQAQTIKRRLQPIRTAMNGLHGEALQGQIQMIDLHGMFFELKTTLMF